MVIDNSPLVVLPPMSGIFNFLAKVNRPCENIDKKSS